ncbi:MAG: CinA family protein [Anaerolineae bacterium]|nr:CinA family protein [Anaerolineae bacterium]MDW8102801.1 CinA family protein [Anaerolineae bacterium]
MLEKEAGELLRKLGLTLAVAESCTGGLLAHRITNVPGSSRYFIGGVVAYSNQVKSALLQVSEETLNTKGAVSEETAIQMARGVRELLKTDIGIGITGIAGPGGGTPTKPVGLVYVALSAPDYEECLQLKWEGHRIQNKRLSTEAALELLIKYLRRREG